jgi:type III secretion protein C
VRIAGREEVDLFNVSVGTSLRVTPHVFKDEGVAKIKLLVTIEDGQQKKRIVGGATVTETIDNIPVIERSAINTQALINAGESVLIGGLVREESSDDEYKVPLLGDLPVVGRLFKNNSKKSLRMERLFLITPRLSIHRIAKNTDTTKLTAEQLMDGKTSNNNDANKTENKDINDTQEVEQDKLDEESWNILLNR